MLRLLFGIILLGSFHISNAQVNLTQSNLPIISIETINTINADSKVAASMKIYRKEDGSINSVTDAPNDYDGNIGIKQRGQTSLFLFDKKGYSLETRDVLGDEESVNLLGMPKEVDWVLHGPYSDKSLMRNALMYTLADSITPYAPRVKMVEMMINNEYMGVYLFTEKIKRDDSRVDISKLKDEDIEGDELTGGYILKFDKSDAEEIGWVSPYSISADQPTNFVLVYPEWDDIQPQQKTYIQNWMTDFEDLLAGPDYTDDDIGYRKSINTESFIDFMLLNELSRNVDAYRLSTYMYKDKDSNDDELHMGPVWDYNLAFGNANYCNGSSIEGWAYDFNDVCGEDMYQNHFWWKRLLTDESYQEDLANKWQKLRNGKFSDANINGLIDYFADQLEVPQVRNFQKWDIIGDYVWPNNFIGQSYDAEVEYLRQWLMDRMEWMDAALDIDLNTGDVAIPSVVISPNPVADVLNINTTSLSSNTVFEIYTVDGQSLGYQSTSSTIDVSNLHHGLYVLKIRDGDKVMNERFIKF